VKASQPKRTYDPECVPPLVGLCTDAARSLGFGAIFENEWFYGSWNELVKDYPIAY
jgi:hypothetical protein